MINIKITIRRGKKPQMTLQQFIKGLITLNRIYGNDSPELSKAVGRYFDTWCQR